MTNTIQNDKMQNNLGHAIIVLKERGRVGAENRIMARTGCTWDEAVYAIGLALRLLPDGWATGQRAARCYVRRMKGEDSAL